MTAQQLTQLTLATTKCKVAFDFRQLFNGGIKSDKKNTFKKK